MAAQIVPFIKSNDYVKGYKFTVIPGPDYFYRISLNGNDIPPDWIVDFRDRTITNRWGVDDLNVDIQGRTCGGKTRSDHDRTYIGADMVTVLIDGVSWGHGACTGYPPTPLKS
jgi:hypothetical protein